MTKKEYFQFILYTPPKEYTENETPSSKRGQYFVSGCYYPIDEHLEKRLIKKYGKDVQVIKPIDESKQVLEDLY